MSRFTVYGSKGWIDIRDKAHVEAPAGWIVTSAFAGGPIVTAEVPPAEPVKDNLVAFARAVRGAETYPITGDQLVDNITLLEAVLPLGRALALEHRLPEPSTLDEALRPPLAHEWRDALLPLRQFASDASAPWKPMAERLSSI